MADMKQIVRSMLVVVAVLCVAHICQAEGKDPYCGRDCSNTCLNGSCDRFLYECKYGCKSERGRNLTRCQTGKPTDTEEQGPPLGLVIGATAGGTAVVVIIICIVVFICLRRRRNSDSGSGPTSQSSIKNTYENPVMRTDDPAYDTAYTELDTVGKPGLPPRDDQPYETPVNN